MSYSNWQGRRPGGELSERRDVRAGRCPAGKMSYTLTVILSFSSVLWYICNGGDLIMTGETI